MKKLDLKTLEYRAKMNDHQEMLALIENTKALNKIADLMIDTEIKQNHTVRSLIDEVISLVAYSKSTTERILNASK